MEPNWTGEAVEKSFQSSIGNMRNSFCKGNENYIKENELKSLICFYVLCRYTDIAT